MANIDVNQTPLGYHSGENLVERSFERIAIVTRGETAQRLIHAVRELNQEKRTQLSTVALFTEPDHRAMFVREADDAVCISQAAFADQQDERQQNRSQDRERIEQALVAAQVDAVWAGSASLAEEPWFADLCQRLGIVFIGPDSNVLRQLGNKISAKHLAQQLNIPVVPGSSRPVETVAEAQQRAEQIGYPLMIKPAFGTKGQGIHLVSSSSELANAFESARNEASRLFGDPNVFIERVVEGAHLVEVQIIADNFGTIWAVGVRDCTVQYHNQKIFEESASLVLPPEQEQELREAAVRLCQAAGYQNIGTVEFLYHPGQRAFWFLEVNPRLTIEHPVTEATTGLDLVKLQLDIARGSRLEGEPPLSTGHAVGVRLYAKDPDNGFVPSPGTLDQYRLASGPGLRIDTGFDEGDTIPSEFDPLLAKIIARGRNRQEAFARLSRSLAESVVVVRGGMSNKAFLLGLLNCPKLGANEIDTFWFDSVVSRKEQQPRLYANVALLQAAVEAYDAELQVEQVQFYTSAVRGRPRIRQEVSVITDFRYFGQPYQLNVSRLSAHHYRVITEGQRIDAKVERFGPFERRVTCFGQRHRVISVIDGPNHYVEVNGIEHRMTREEGGIVRAPSPTVVVSVLVAPGDSVNAGDRLVVVEVMKVEMAIPAPFAGRVARLFVTSNVQVDAGAPLVQLEPLQDNEPVMVDHVRFNLTEGTITPTPDNPQARCQWILEELRNQMLGYDIDPAESKRLLSEQRAICQVIAPDDQGLQSGENEILSIFADTCSLFRRELDPAEAEVQGEQVHSAEQDLITYLSVP